jgi:gamma-glutamyltranspeptidase/glutathione hydrolase
MTPIITPNHHATGPNVASAGHPLATEAAVEIYKKGGNAIDAACAAAFVMHVVEPHQNGIAGEAPLLIYSAKEKRVISVSGVGFSPKKFTIDWCRENGIDLIPNDGYLPITVPAAVKTWFETVNKYGTMKFSDLIDPAIHIAENGFPVYEQLHGFLQTHCERFNELYPSTGSIYLDRDKVPELGCIIKNPDFADMLKSLRDAGDKACELFYEGKIAKRMIEFIKENPVLDASGREHTGLLDLDDLGEWQVSFEEPVSYEYSGVSVHKCNGWTQGPVFLQQLALREGIDFMKLSESLANHVHEYIERAKLAFADREAYYGDPAFDKIPIEKLLSKEYNDERRKLLSDNASKELRPGDVGHGIPDYVTFDVKQSNRAAMGMETVSALSDGDTTILLTADSQGNMLASCPSGGWIHTSPVIPGLGFCMPTRGQMFYLDPNRPNALEPHKRPRATLTPSLVTKNDEPYLAFGTPGGDKQDQWTFQFFMNFVDYGFGLKQSLDLPLCQTDHVPASFYPRACRPGGLVIEKEFGDDVIDELKNRGHDVLIETILIRMQALARKDDGTYETGVRKTSTTGHALGI